MESFFVDFALPAAMVLFGVGALFAILGSVYNSFNNPKALVKSVIGIVALLVIFGIGYAAANSNITPIYTEFGVNESGSKMIGGILNMMYILVVLAIVGIIADSVLKFIR